VRQMVTARVASLAMAAALFAACSQAQPTGRPAADSAPRPAVTRPLVVMIRVEPATLASRPLVRTGGVTTATLVRLFNAGLVVRNERGDPQPDLAEQLPALNTDAWQVFPDGRMQTTYVLKPNLVWHDGTALSAEDFVLSWQIYSTPEMGQATSLPFGLMESVRAADDRTVVIQWKRPYPDAGALLAVDFPAFPRHILQQSFQQDTPEAFLANAFWSRGYVGLGPYRIDGWEPGSSIEASAFDGYALGRPSIGRIQVRWSSDPNTVVANILAGEVHVAADDSLQSSSALILKREWAQRTAGGVLLTPTLWRAAQVQQRTDVVNPRALLDLRVRRALAHAIDKDALNGALFEGEGIMSSSMIPPTDDSFAEIDRSVRKYAYDLRQSEQSMNEAGWVKAQDGTFVHPAEGRFSAELKVNGGAQYESEMSILAAGWRQAGFDFTEMVNPAALAQDGEVRSTFSGVFASSGPLGEDLLRSYSSANIPRPENRWVGRNRIAWINPEYDRLVEAFNTTLDPRERIRQEADMARIFSEELPEISLYFDPGVIAYVAGLTGPRLVAPRGIISWDIHRWTWVS